MSVNPIGIFDSGVGGLTVWQAIQKQLPNESIIYLADQKNCPYGNKSKREIEYLTLNAVKYLLSQSCKLIVIACNTATAVVVHKLREKYTDILFVGLEPAVKPAALSSKRKVIGVLATANTLKGNHYLETSKKYRNYVKINEVAGNGLVELIESGKDEEKLRQLIVGYLNELDYLNIDFLVLGCTHYPLIRKQITVICGDAVKIIDSSKAVAQQVERLLSQENSLKIEGHQTFYKIQTTQNIEDFKKFIAINGFLERIPVSLISYQQVNIETY